MISIVFIFFFRFWIRWLFPLNDNFFDSCSLPCIFEFGVIEIIEFFPKSFFIWFWFIFVEAGILLFNILILVFLLYFDIKEHIIFFIFSFVDNILFSVSQSLVFFGSRLLLVFEASVLVRLLAISFPLVWDPLAVYLIREVWYHVVIVIFASKHFPQLFWIGKLVIEVE